MHRNPFWWFPLFLFSVLAQAQVVDDSTKQVYGPSTSRFVLEQDILANRDTLYRVDTLLNYFHRYNFVNRNGNRMIDLGNLGTALRPVFYSLPAQIGTPFGINVYSPYAYHLEDVRYFDTKSPYSNLYYTQGGLFQQLLKVSFSRNINPRWNVGFDYQRFTSAKLFNYDNRGQDRLIDHHAFLFYTRYQSKDSTYQVLAHFSHLNHNSIDQGGVFPIRPNYSRDSLLIDFYGGLTSEAQLLRARSNDLRNNFHLYHQYAFAKGLQIYHIADSYNQRYRYRDLDPYNEEFLDVFGRYFYPGPPYLDTAVTDLTDETTKYELIENKAGLKGSLAGWDYRVYARRRDWIVRRAVRNMPDNLFSPKDRQSENFVGVWSQYRFSKKARLYAEGEYLLFRDYKLSGVFENQWFRGGYTSMYYSPSIIQQKMSTSHFRWNNDYKPTLANTLFGSLSLRLKNLELAPSASLSNLNRYTYFTTEPNEDGQTVFTSKQEERAVQLITLGGQIQYNWKNFYTVNDVVFTRRFGPAAIQIPEWFINSQLYYQNALFKKALYIQLGFDVHYKSAYFADAYMPAIGQFYVQQDFKVSDYAIVDVFLNARIRRVRLFFKIAHINQGLIGNGYFTAPYFPGQARSLGFGVNWPLFD